MVQEDIIALGYSPEEATRILILLSEKSKLRRYLQKAEEAGCRPVTRVSAAYPQILRERLQDDAPGTIWAKGDLSLLSLPAISVVGSRALMGENRKFAAEVGRQAALQNYVLISGNARGADSIAQESCLATGGKVIAIVPDALSDYPLRENVLYLSADAFDAPFSSPRALYRNQLIHCMGQKVFVVQCSLGKGGTWSGTVNNLKRHYSDVFCFRDESEASVQLSQLGAILITAQELLDIGALESHYRQLSL
jgi:DNA processing protein